MDFKQIFIDSCKDFKLNVTSKLRELNNFRVSALDVVKTFKSQSIHHQVFKVCFKEGELGTLRLICKVFGSESMIRFNQHKDLSLVCPLMYVTLSHNDNLERGDLVIPICKLPPLTESIEDQNMQIFVPSDSDDLEEASIALDKLLPFDPKVLPEERLVSFGISTRNERNFVSLKKDHGLNVGDYIVVRGKHYRIVDIHPDDFSTKVEGSRNMIYVDRNFENNTNNQPLRFKRMIYIHGKLLSIPVSKLKVFRGFFVNFTKNKNDTNHGEMNIKFSCVVFNSGGFFTRNLAIAEEDMAAI